MIDITIFNVELSTQRYIYLYHIITNTIICNAGLGAKDLALRPEDKHLFRLAKLINVKACTSLFIRLGLPQPTWDEIQHMYRNDITVAKFVAFCKWKDLRHQQMSEPSFRELSDALAEDYDTHLLCQVGNNCSHR